MASGKTFPLSLVVKVADAATAPLRKISASVGDISKATSQLGKTLTLGLTAPLAAAGVASVAACSRFEAGMASVSTLVDTTTESMDAMGEAVLGISKRVPVGLGDLTDALATARGTGVTAADAMSVLENSAKLGVAALGTTKDAVKMVVGAMNAWQLKGEDAKGIYNTLFKATAAGAANLSELSQGFGSVAGVAANAGVKLDEYVAAAEALTTTTRPASEAHTQLKAVLSGLTRQTKLTRAVFGKLGAKDIRELIAESGGLVPALERIKIVLGGSDTKMLELLGSTEALTAALDLTGSQSGPFKELLGSIRSSSDGVSVAFEKQNRTGAATMQRLQNSLEGVAISVGRVLVPVLDHLTPVLERLVTKWEALGSDGQKSIIVMAAAAAALGPTITVMGHLATAVHAANAAMVFTAGWGKYLWMMRASIISGLVPSLTAATTSVWGFTAALLANPITWVVVAVGALAAAAYQVYKNWEPLKEFFTSIWEEPKEAFALFAGWVWDLFKTWSPLALIVDNWEPVETFFHEFWSRVSDNFTRAWEKIRPIIEKLQSALSYTPLGLAMTGGLKLGDALSDGTRPTLGAAGAAPARGGVAQGGEARVTVDFANMPKGARATPDRSSDFPVDLNLGYSMGPT